MVLQGRRGDAEGFVREMGSLAMGGGCTREKRGDGRWLHEAEGFVEMGSLVGSQGRREKMLVCMEMVLVGNAEDLREMGRWPNPSANPNCRLEKTKN